VKQAQKACEAIGTLTSGTHALARDIFEDVYETMPPHLLKQRHEAGY